MTVAWISLSGILIFVVGIPLAILFALAAYKMLQLDSYYLVFTAAIVAMLPCHPGFVIGLPIGIWALVVLLRPEVKAAFDERRAMRSHGSVAK